PADLVGHHAVVYDQPAGGTEWTFRCGAAETSIKVDGRVYLSAAEGVRQAVFAGMGLVIASEWLFGPELEAGMVRSVLDEWTLPRLAVWAVCPAGGGGRARGRPLGASLQRRLPRPARPQGLARGRAPRKRP